MFMDNFGMLINFILGLFRILRKWNEGIKYFKIDLK